MSRNINKLAQDTALIVVQTDASEFGIYVKRTTLVSVVSTGLLAILMENGTAVDSLDTTLHKVLGIPDIKAPGYIKRGLGSESIGDIPQYLSTSAATPLIGPSGITVTQLQNLIISDGNTADKLHNHIKNFDNPHKVKKNDVGLGNVDNTADADKPISDATSIALLTKANVGGDPNQRFQVAYGTLPTDAVNVQQMNGIRNGALNYRTPDWRVNQKSYPDETLTETQIGYFWECSTTDYDKDGRLWKASEWIVYIGKAGGAGGNPAFGASWSKLNTLSGYTFIGANDTPVDYTGSGGKITSVKIDESGLEFINLPAGEPSLGNPTTDGDMLISTIAGVRSWTTPAAAGEAPLGNPTTDGDILASTVAGVRSWVGPPSGLEKITEGGTGWRLIGRDPAKYGNIGQRAVDFSNPTSLNSTTRGATGSESFATGWGTTASGYASHSSGFYTTASGRHSHTGGYGKETRKQVIASGESSFNHQQALAANADAAGDNSAILGGVDNSIVAGATKAVVLGGTNQVGSQPNMVYIMGTKYWSYTTTEIVGLPTPEAGTIVYDNTKKKLQIHDGTTWSDLGISIPTGAKNAYIYGPEGKNQIVIGFDTNGGLKEAKEWLVTDTYVSGDVVHHNNSLWWANIPAVGDEPGVVSTWTLYLGSNLIPGTNPVYIDPTLTYITDSVPTIALDGTVTYPTNPVLSTSIAGISSGPAKGIVTKEYVLDVAIGGTTYKGSKDPATDTFPIDSTGAVAGEFWVMAGDGDITLNTGDPATTAVKVGDHVIWDGAKWELVQNPSPAITDQLQYVPKAIPNAPPKEGDTYYQTGNGIQVFNGTGWDDLNEKSTGLEKITEGGNTGWRLIGSDPTIHGDIGDHAIDMSLGSLTGSAYGATGRHSFASGFEVAAEGMGSRVSGVKNIAKGDYSSAEGEGNNANGDHSHAEGYQTTADGRASHSEGLNTIAEGNFSHATGELTKAGGEGSYAGGASGDHIASNIVTGKAAFSHQEVTDNREIRGDNSAVLGGVDNVIKQNADRSVVLGGQGLIAEQADMVYLTGTKYKTFTQAEILKMVNSEDGTIVFNGDTKELQKYNAAKTIWEDVSEGELISQVLPVFEKAVEITFTSANFTRGGDHIGSIAVVNPSSAPTSGAPLKATIGGVEYIFHTLNATASSYIVTYEHGTMPATGQVTKLEEGKIIPKHAFKLKDAKDATSGVGSVNLSLTEVPTQENMVYVGGVKYKSYTTTQVTALPTPEAGTVVYDSDKKKLQIYDGTAWVDIGAGGGSLGNYSFDGDDFKHGVDNVIAYSGVIGVQEFMNYQYHGNGMSITHLPTENRVNITATEGTGNRRSLIMNKSQISLSFTEAANRTTLVVKNNEVTLPDTTIAHIDAAPANQITTKEWVESKTGGGIAEPTADGLWVRKVTNSATTPVYAWAEELDGGTY